jgi:hypothetical protein
MYTYLFCIPLLLHRLRKEEFVGSRPGSSSTRRQLDPSVSLLYHDISLRYST